MALRVSQVSGFCRDFELGISGKEVASANQLDDG
jgi:hypothetical protein